MATTFPSLIDGKQLDSTDRTTDINPSNLSDVVGEFARASASDIDEAIASARATFKKRIDAPRQFTHAPLEVRVLQEREQLAIGRKHFRRLSAVKRCFARARHCGSPAQSTSAIRSASL